MNLNSDSLSLRNRKPKTENRKPAFYPELARRHHRPAPWTNWAPPPGSRRPAPWRC